MPKQVSRGQGSELRESCKEASGLSALAAAGRANEDDSGTSTKPAREDHGKKKKQHRCGETSAGRGRGDVVRSDLEAGGGSVTASGG